MNTTLRTHFDNYAAFHKTAGNQTCHMIAIPLIVLTSFALCAKVSLFVMGGFRFTLAEVLFALTALFYFTLDIPLALALNAFSAFCLYAGRLMPWTWALAVFVVAWVLQFIGHSVYEKKAPAFLTNIVHLLIGPMWITGKLTGRA